ncbi:MAG: hypothetical protein HYU51_03505 [Candidatus Rokubacteria bacterium]|nr:hypothetical protein [Candidatus Rokubacteria bacterium]
MIKTVNVRGLKDRLSAYLRDVQRGDVVLVTDRGRVVAELRQPTTAGIEQPAIPPRLRKLVEAGVLTVGLPNSADAYPRSDVRLSVDVVTRALDETRRDR